MAEAEVFHRLYTHAPAGRHSTTGARIVELEDHDARALLPAELLKELDALLRKVTPSSSTKPGHVACRYVSGADAFACLIVVHPGLILDAEGRPGLLTHARVVRTDALEAALDLTELVEVERRLPINDIDAGHDPFMTYIDRLEGESVVLQAVSAADLQQLPTQFMTDVLTALLAVIDNRNQTQFRLTPPPAPLLAQLALASCALPIGLQRVSSWGVDVGSGCPVDALFSTTNGRVAVVTAGDRLVGCVKRYVSFLTEAPQELQRILRNPEVRSAAEFGGAVDRAAVQAPYSTAVGRSEMPRNKEKKSDPPRVRDEAELDPALVAELNRQVRAVEQELRGYIDQRFAEMESRSLSTSRETRSTPWWSRPHLRNAALAGLAIAIVAAVLLFTPLNPWKKTRVLAGSPTATTDPDVVDRDAIEAPLPDSTAEVSDQEIVRTAIRSIRPGTWAQAFKTLIETQPDAVNRFIRRSAENSALEAPDADALEGFAVRIGDPVERQKMTGKDRKTLRQLLLRSIDLQWARRDRSADGQRRQMMTLFEGLRRTSGQDSEDRYDMEAELILRWMEWQQ